MTLHNVLSGSYIYVANTCTYVCTYNVLHLAYKIMFNLIAGNHLLAVKSMCKEAEDYTTFPLLGLDCNFKEWWKKQVCIFLYIV